MRQAIALLILAVVPGISAETGRSLPLFFFRNTSQVNSGIRFITETPRFRAGFQTDSIIFQIHDRNILLKFAGSDPNATIQGADPMPGKANFLVGDREKWSEGVPTYHKVLYRGLYPGIDMTYAGSSDRIKSEFLVAPGADPSRIRLDYGEANVSIDSNGDLLVASGKLEMREEAPIVYQESRNGRTSVQGRYRLLDQHTVAFEIGAYNDSLPLVIDPVVSYCTYLGGGAMGSVTGVAVDSGGNLYATGWTEAIDFPIAGAAQSGNQGGVDVFVIKLNPAGTSLVYATYIGGRGDDRGAAIAVDGSGQAYVTGSTASSNFPLVSAIRTTLGGGRDAFALKLNASGNALLYSTYLGGTNYDIGTAVAVDGSGNAYIAGDTYSSDFPVTGTLQNGLSGQADAFVTRLTPSGAISFSTMLGGWGVEHAGGVAVDSIGNMYVTGGTSSTNFPLTGAPLQSTNRGGQDAFVTKIAASGQSFIYSTYLGGTGTFEQGNGIAADSSGNAYVTGVTNSSNFPVTAGAYQSAFNGVYDGFVTKVNPTGSALVYSTYLGGTSFDWPTGIAIDSGANAYIVGYTSSFDYPVSGGVQAAFNGLYDAFVSKLNPAGAALTFSSYYGGSGMDVANAIAVDAAGNVFTGGQTSSVDLSLQSYVQAYNRGGNTGWVMRIGFATVQPQPPQAVSVSPASGSGTSQTFSFVYSDTNGGADLTSAQVVINTAVTGAGSCFILVDPVRRTAVMANDTFTVWLGPVNLGSTGTLQNSQCTVNAAGSGVTISGSTVTVNLAVTFGAGFTGVKNVFALGQNAGGLDSGWQRLGGWTVTGAGNQPPQTVSVTPASGTGSSQTFSFVYSDPNGASDIVSAQVVINSAVTGAASCFVLVDPRRNTAVMANDPFTVWLGPITLGTSTTLQNSQCTLNGAGSSITISGNTLTVTLAMSFPASYSGARNLFALAQDAAGLNSGWQNLGTFTVTGGIANQAPQAVGVSPASGTGRSQTFTFTYFDANGGSDITSAQVVVNSAVAGAASCFVLIDPIRRTALMANDQFTVWMGPIAFGTSTTLQNSQCTVNGTGSSVSVSGNTVTVTLALTFQPGYAGLKNLYALAQDAAGLNSGWQVLGSWTVN